MSAPHIYALSAYISGAADALDDYAFSIGSFGLSKRSADTSYYAISAPFSAALIDALLARPEGAIHILRDGVAWESFNVSLPIRYDIGPGSASISISGTRQESNASPATHAIDSSMVASQSINSSGVLTLDMILGCLDPMPGDSVTWGGDEYTLTLIKYYAGSQGQTLSYICDPVA